MSFDEREAKIDELVNNGMWPTLSPESAFHLGFDAGLQAVPPVEVVFNEKQAVEIFGTDALDEMMAQMAKEVRGQIERSAARTTDSTPIGRDDPGIIDWDGLSQILDSLYAEIVRINTKNGWRPTESADWDVDDHRVLGYLMLASTEIAEAAEAFRRQDKENFVEEIADVFIRLIETTRGLGFDLVGAVERKLDKNRNREYKHGGKRI